MCIPYQNLFEMHVEKFLSVTPKFCSFFRSFRLNMKKVNISYSSSWCWQNLVYGLVCRRRWLQMHLFCLQWALLYSWKTWSRMQVTGQAVLSRERANLIIQKSPFSLSQCYEKLLLDLRARSCQQWGCVLNRKGRWDAVPKEGAAALSAPWTHTSPEECSRAGFCLKWGEARRRRVPCRGSCFFCILFLRLWYYKC